MHLWVVFFSTEENIGGPKCNLQCKKWVWVTLLDRNLYIFFLQFLKKIYTIISHIWVHKTLINKTG